MRTADPFAPLAASHDTVVVDAVDSVQLLPDGTPRFRIPALTAHPEWDRAVSDEQAGGVSAELRIFLDAQLEAGDVLVDVAPGFGFVALSAATAPGGTPSVFVQQALHASMDGIERAARDAGGWVEVFTAGSLADGSFAEQIAERLSPDGRVFVHADVVSLPAALRGLAPLVVLGRIVACCLSPAPAAAPEALAEASALLATLGFSAHEMREQDDEPQLFATHTLYADRCQIAIVGTPAAMTEHPSVVVHDMPSPAGATCDHDVASSSTHAVLAPPTFSFIAPYCRTGYGIAGAHLLREFLRQDAPVAYFPLGHVDQSVVRIEALDQALARQGSFDDRAPSVRLSQQFDLALHAGRGPRIGFPIFELDRLHPNERHHLERQDRLLVTCEWARDVLLENGLWRTPIDIVPLGVDRAVFHERVQPVTRAPADTLFLSVGKLEARKGQLELLRAFESAFKPSDRVRLVLVCHNPFVDEKTFDAMIAPFRSSRFASRITVVAKPLPTQRDLAAVMASADCAVFPVRAEGWNLEALEMLSMGKHVIATACTGHTAFLNGENARLISIDALEESMPGETRGRWAAWGAAQHEQLVAHMRAVHEARQHGSLDVNRAGIATAERFSWTASANALMHSVAAA